MDCNQENRDKVISSDHFESGSKTSLCRWAKGYMSTNAGYPYFNPKYVATYIERPETSDSDLTEYKATHSPVKYCIRLVMMISSSCFFLRVMAIPTIVLTELNLNNFTANFEWRSDDLNQISCIVTNCTGATVDADTLSNRLAELPYFSICHPQLSAWHDVLQYLGILGIMLSASSGLAVLIAGLVLPLVNKLRPTGNLFLMFLVAPSVTRRVVEDRAQELLVEMEHSKRNFHNFSHTRHRFRCTTQGKSDCEMSASCRLAANTLVNGTQAPVNLRAAPDYAAIHQDGEKKDSVLNSLSEERSLLRRRLRDLQSISSMDSVDSSSQTHSGHQLLSAVEHLRPHMSIKNFQQILQGDQSLCDKWLSNDKVLDTMYNWNSDFTPTTSSSSLNYKAYAQDCVTMLRSAWWHTRATSAMWELSIITLGNLPVQILVCVFALYYYANQRRIIYRSIADDLHQWNCSLWIQIDNTHTSSANPLDELEPLDIDSLEINFNLALSIFYVAQCIWPFICVNFFLLSYFLTNAELICWLYEIKLGLTMAVEFVRQILDDDKNSHFVDATMSDASMWTQSSKYEPKMMSIERSEMADLGSSFARSEGKKFDMDILRAKAKQIIDLKLLWVVHKQPSERLGGTKSKFEAARAIEKFVARAIRKHRMKQDAAAEMLEKLYINFRIFSEHVDHYGAVMSIMLTFTNIYIYAFVLVGVFSLRSIKDHVLFPALLLSIGWTSANGLILLPSNLHAKAKGLHALIWTLVAIMNDCSDNRLRHMRSLWIKQVVALDRDGGLALKAFRVRITYVRIVQLIIGTGTLVVFALRL